VVDGNWVTDHTAPQENDESGNLNNVLTTDRIVKHTPETVGIMSGVTPTSTTAQLAKDVPLEKAPVEQTGSSDLPGSFPETPAAVEKGDFSVNPLPAADGAVNPIKLAPGEKIPDSNTFTNNTITSKVHDDPELVAADKGESEPTFSVAPLPAFPGAVNPIHVAPGEKLPEPSTLTGNTIQSSVRTDKESYENSGAFGTAPVLPPVVTPQSERDHNGTGILDLPPISKNLIPESSLPMGGTGAGFDASPLVQSAGPQSTTSQLAAAVPLESSKVPEVVKESQQEAGVGPEASAVPEEVKEKSAVEKELLSEVPVAPATSEGAAGEGTAGDGTAKDTPEVVKESIAESGQSPEAAGNEEAVLEKKAVEKELLSEIKPETSTGESAPKIASTAGGLSAPTPDASKDVESRDVSPHTQTTPTVTTGVAATTTTDKTTSATPAKDSTVSPPTRATPGSSKAPESPASSSVADKKKKRTSFFGKLKAIAKGSDKKKD
jgi:hypothetical protein